MIYVWGRGRNNEGTGGKEEPVVMRLLCYKSILKGKHGKKQKKQQWIETVQVHSSTIVCQAGESSQKTEKGTFLKYGDEKQQKQR